MKIIRVVMVARDDGNGLLHRESILFNDCGTPQLPWDRHLHQFTIARLESGLPMRDSMKGHARAIWIMQGMRHIIRRVMDHAGRRQILYNNSDTCTYLIFKL